LRRLFYSIGNNTGEGKNEALSLTQRGKAYNPDNNSKLMKPTEIFELGK